MPESEMGSGLKIGEIMTDETLSKVEGAMWNAFKGVTTNSLGNSKEENYESLVEEIHGMQRSLKFIFLKLHPNFCLIDLGAVQ
jgi:hypothetical protein